MARRTRDSASRATLATGAWGQPTSIVAARRAVAHCTTGMPWVVTNGSMPPVPSSRSRMRHKGVLASRVQEGLEGGVNRCMGVVAMLENRRIDRVEEAFALVDDEGLGELVATAELVVDGLAGDARRAGHVGHRDLRPGAVLKL